MSSSESVVPESGALSGPENGLRKFLKEPLLHFLVIGAAIFGVHAMIAPPAGKEKTIEVSPETYQSITELFESDRHRKPTKEELSRLVDVWVLNEVTYREALAQGLDRGDEMIRERIMQKMRLLVFGNVDIKDPTEADIKEWFESHRTRYDPPDTVSFFELTFPKEGEKEARAILEQINTGSEPEEVRLRAHVFADRPLNNVETTFGKDFLAALVKAPQGEWQVVQSANGWHIVRLDGATTGTRTEIKDIETQLITDWKDDYARRMGISKLKDIAKSYTIKRHDS